MYRRMLFIGLGGSGGKTLRFMKSGLNEWLERHGWDEGVPSGFQFVHILLWKQHNQEIPKGMFVVFKDRNKMNITIENLELIDRAENMRRNSYVNLPEEIKEVIHIKKQITRKINSYGKK